MDTGDSVTQGLVDTGPHGHRGLVDTGTRGHWGLGRRGVQTMGDSWTRRVRGHGRLGGATSGKSVDGSWNDVHVGTLRPLQTTGHLRGVGGHITRRSERGPSIRTPEEYPEVLVVSDGRHPRDHDGHLYERTKDPSRGPLRDEVRGQANVPRFGSVVSPSR